MIKMSFKKDKKGPGRHTGFSTNVDTVKRWNIKATYRALLQTCFQKHINYHPQK